ncbi:NAD-dependent epimerase/dehydratase family protein [Sphingobacterium suaedae]|uniref:NAD-dependent epimerase/dehydratase family protein n=1 Tax=Sphingobacterium suaedae TaxID=1686402 RepID=A0ABW5KLA3_9SPHI
MMSIIITGASGFVGTNLSTFFESRNIDVISLSLRDPMWKAHFPNAASSLIHLAGKAHDVLNTSSSEDYFKINRDLTIELFDRFLESDVCDFFFFSSVKAVTDAIEGVLSENCDANPRTPYGKSKYDAEQYLLRKTLPQGKRLFIIRPCMIHGVGNKGNLNLLYNVVKKGLPWPLADFSNQRSFLSIHNLTFLLERMMQNRKLSSGVYNFADDEAMSTNELVELIGEVVERRPKFWRVPAFLITNLVKIGDVIPLPLNSERLKKLTESYVVSNAKIKKSLDIQKLPLSTRQGLIMTIRSFSDNDQLNIKK